MNFLETIASQFVSSQNWSLETKIKLYEIAITNNNLKALKILSEKLQCGKFISQSLKKIETYKINSYLDAKFFSRDTKLNFYKIAIKRNYLNVVKFLHKDLNIGKTKNKISTQKIIL